MSVIFSSSKSLARLSWSASSHSSGEFLQSWHFHTSVHTVPFFVHLQRLTMHWVLQLQIVHSITSNGAGSWFVAVAVGTKLLSDSFYPNRVGSGKIRDVWHSLVYKSQSGCVVFLTKVQKLLVADTVNFSVFWLNKSHLTAESDVTMSRLFLQHRPITHSCALQDFRSLVL